MSDITDRVSNVVVSRLHIEPDRVTEAANFIDDFAATSLDIVETIMSLEDEFGVRDIRPGCRKAADRGRYRSADQDQGALRHEDQASSISRPPNLAGRSQIKSFVMRTCIASCRSGPISV